MDDATPVRVRDRRHRDFYWMDNELLDRFGPAMGQAGIAVYNALARHAYDGASCHPSIATIGHCAGGLSPASVRRAVARLESLQLLRTTYTFNREGQSTNTYTLLALPAAPVAAPRPPRPTLTIALPTPPIKNERGGCQIRQGGAIKNGRGGLSNLIGE